MSNIFELISLSEIGNKSFIIDNANKKKTSLLRLIYFLTMAFFCVITVYIFYNNYSDNKILKYNAKKISYEAFKNIYYHEKNNNSNSNDNKNQGKNLHLIIGIIDGENNFIDSNIFNFGLNERSIKKNLSQCRSYGLDYSSAMCSELLTIPSLDNDFFNSLALMINCRLSSNKDYCPLKNNFLFIGINTFKDESLINMDKYEGYVDRVFKIPINYFFRNNLSLEISLQENMLSYDDGFMFQNVNNFDYLSVYDKNSYLSEKLNQNIDNNTLMTEIIGIDIFFNLKKDYVNVVEKQKIKLEDVFAKIIGNYIFLYICFYLCSYWYNSSNEYLEIINEIFDISTVDKQLEEILDHDFYIQNEKQYLKENALYDEIIEVSDDENLNRKDHLKIGNFSLYNNVFPNKKLEIFEVVESKKYEKNNNINEEIYDDSFDIDLKKSNNNANSYINVNCSINQVKDYSYKMNKEKLTFEADSNSYKIEINNENHNDNDNHKDNDNLIESSNDYEMNMESNLKTITNIENEENNNIFIENDDSKETIKDKINILSLININDNWTLSNKSNANSVNKSIKNKTVCDDNFNNNFKKKEDFQNSNFVNKNNTDNIVEDNKIKNLKKGMIKINHRNNRNKISNLLPNVNGETEEKNLISVENIKEDEGNIDPNNNLITENTNNDVFEEDIRNGKPMKNGSKKYNHFVKNLVNIEKNNLASQEKIYNSIMNYKRNDSNDNKNKINKHITFRNSLASNKRNSLTFNDNSKNTITDIFVRNNKLKIKQDIEESSEEDDFKIRSNSKRKTTSLKNLGNINSVYKGSLSNMNQNHKIMKGTIISNILNIKNDDLNISKTSNNSDRHEVNLNLKNKDKINETLKKQNQNNSNKEVTEKPIHDLKAYLPGNKVKKTKKNKVLSYDENNQEKHYSFEMSILDQFKLFYCPCIANNRSCLFYIKAKNEIENKLKFSHILKQDNLFDAIKNIILNRNHIEILDLNNKLRLTNEHTISKQIRTFKKVEKMKNLLFDHKLKLIKESSLSNVKNDNNHNHIVKEIVSNNNKYNEDSLKNNNDIEKKIILKDKEKEEIKINNLMKSNTLKGRNKRFTLDKNDMVAMVNDLTNKRNKTNIDEKVLMYISKNNY